MCTAVLAMPALCDTLSPFLLQAILLLVQVPRKDLQSGILAAVLDSLWAAVCPRVLAVLPCEACTYVLNLQAGLGHLAAGSPDLGAPLSLICRLLTTLQNELSACFLVSTSTSSPVGMQLFAHGMEGPLTV